MLLLGASASTSASAQTAASGTPSNTALSSLPWLPPGMNETVVRVPVDGADSGMSLETTLFKPDGKGPFPVVIFNHGKERGDPRLQERSRPLSFARPFVQRGYLVVAPNREGFANSDGVYSEALCGIDQIGIQQAVDIAATVKYVKQLPYAQPNRIVVAGASQGGLASVAYDAGPADPGVVGIINFSGGLRQDGCSDWQQAMIDAFHDYGLRARLPSLWLYGDNDRFWPASLARRLLAVFRAGGADATLIDFGRYKDNAHRLVGDRDGVPVWWPDVADFLQRIGMPTALRYQASDIALPPASHYAPLSAIDAVPYLDDGGRAGYQTFLHQYPTRAFAISSTGAWSWAEGGDDPISVALDNCQRNSRVPCHLYAVDRTVVWVPH